MIIYLEVIKKMKIKLPYSRITLVPYLELVSSFVEGLFPMLTWLQTTFNYNPN